MKRKIVLLAAVGTSPAVLTETVWALAHSGKPVVPDEVVALTTTAGREAMRRADFFGPGGVWDRLRAALRREKLPVAGKLVFGDTSQHVRIPASADGTADLPDIATTEDNARVADFFLDAVRPFADNPGVALYTSIAGGRKTMGALLLCCMSLLGRDGDRVLHVLVSEPFERPLDPPFLFPERGARHKTPAGKTVSASKALISLIDIPFVKMRGWYQDKFKTLPPHYGDLVRAAQSAGPEPSVQKPTLRFDFENGYLFADENRIPLSAAEFLALSADLLLAPINLAEALVAVHGRVGGDFGWLGNFASGTIAGNRFASAETADEDLRKVRSSLRGKLRNCPALKPHVDDLVPRGKNHGVWPGDRMSADIPDFKKRIGF